MDKDVALQVIIHVVYACGKKVIFKEEKMHCDAVYLNYTSKYMHDYLTARWS